LIIDYLIVGAIQLAALIYGFSVVAVSRTVFVAFIKDRFGVVTAVEFDDVDLFVATNQQYKFKSWLGPVMVAIQFPTDTKERNELLFSAVVGKDAPLMPKYYRPYETMIDEIKSKSEPLEILITQHPEKKQELEIAVKNSRSTSANLHWLPVKSRFGFWTALIDTETGYPVKYLPIDPY
jgi:hypothetical protein